MKLTRITSGGNKRISELKKLIGKAAFRRETGLSVAEGIKLSLELFREKAEVKELYLTPKYLKTLPEDYLSSVGEIIEITEEIAEKVSDQKTPEGIFAVFKTKVLKSAEFGSGKYIILDRIQDIGNAGTIIRSADAFSINGVIVSPDSCDVFSPKGLRSSMGSVLRVNIYECNAIEAVKKLKEKGALVFASVLSEEKSDRIENIVFPDFSAVVIGNEGSGVSEEVILSCQNKLTIPMSGKAESLNAAVAAGIIMFHMGKGE
ncbi:MAG: RNA methyltransferase [Oscillospiraceae bacterium]|nr:RNA methyltransferase [Oscillospiraceae bacterium]